MGNSGKSNGKIWAKAMRKLGNRRHIFRAKIIAFARISHYFSPNFPLLLHEFSIPFSLISHCFCPNFLLLLPEFPTAFARIFRFQFFLGGTVPPCPPPPASYAYGPATVTASSNSKAITLWEEQRIAKQHLAKLPIPTSEQLAPGHKSEWKLWKSLNRLRTGMGRSKPT